VAIENARLHEGLRKTLEDTIRVVGLTTEMRDPYTAKHQQQVTDLACAIAREMSIPEGRIEGIHAAGLMHDIGKISIPAEILTKPAKLTDLEVGLIKTHPQVAYDILKGIEFPWPVADIVLQHHERRDGSGYPNGLKGDEIMLEARILAVADVVEAMSSHRPYRPARGLDKALEEIKENAGKLYDPKIVDACLKLFANGIFKFAD
jgi:putative nucleotidyltransferase with HDIG domain